MNSANANGPDGTRIARRNFGQASISRRGTAIPAGGSPSGTGESPVPPVRGFTLIELLVTIAVIALLAGMLFPVGAHVTMVHKISSARSELTLIESAIINYHTRTGTYPPSNPKNYALSALYYELAGTTNNTALYVTLDGRSQITSASLSSVFGVQGLMNSGASVKGSDEAPGPQNFIQNIPNGYTAPINNNSNLVFACPASTSWQRTPLEPNPPIPGAPTVVPFQYNSSNPTNNTTFDLWVDLPIGGHVYRVCNWSKGPIHL